MASVAVTYTTRRSSARKKRDQKTNAPQKTSIGPVSRTGVWVEDVGTGTSRYKRGAEGSLLLHRKRISNKTHTRPSPHPMPPPFNSLTLNYSGRPGSEWCLGGEEVCRRGKGRLMCIHTTFVTRGGGRKYKRKRGKFQLSSSVPTVLWS